MIAVTAIPESGTRRELARVLTSAGWIVHHALTADDVVTRCRQHEADVVLIDQAFPGGSLELLARLKTDSDLFRIAVVLVADGLDVRDVVSAMDRGAADVLRTPLDPADVVGRATAAARQKALVKELTEQQDHIAELVLSDELTGLRNRRAILTDLEGLLATSNRHDHDLAVLMIDIDKFKDFNDTYGHAVGDDVLRGVARRLESRLRTGDVAGRLGGDELMVLLPETDAAGAASVAQSIRAGMSDEPFKTQAGRVTVTVSIGSAAWEGETSSGLVERADAALYAAKNAGRDQAAAAAVTS